MSDAYLKGKVIIVVKPGVDHADIEKILEEHSHIDNYQVPTEKEGILSRLYALSVPEGAEAEVVKDLINKYASLMDKVYQPPIRRLS